MIFPRTHQLFEKKESLPISHDLIMLSRNLKSLLMIKSYVKGTRSYGKI